MEKADHDQLTAASERQRLVCVTGKLVPASNPDPVVDRVEVWRVFRPVQASFV